MQPTLKWHALEKENHEHAAAYHMYQPDVTFELEPWMCSHLSHAPAGHDLLYTKNHEEATRPVWCRNHIRQAGRHHRPKCHMIERTQGIPTSCYKAQQLVSCLPSTHDGQGKLDAYDVQLRSEKARPVGMRVWLEMITHDLFALKMAWKSGNPQ